MSRDSLELGTDKNVTEGSRERPHDPLLADRLLACADSRGAGYGKRGLVTSVAIHALLVAALTALPARFEQESDESLSFDVVFYAEPAPLDEPVRLPAAPGPEADPPREPEPRPVATPPAIEQPRVEQPVIARDEWPAPPPAEPKVPDQEEPAPAPTVAVSPAPPAKLEPTVRTEVFDSEPAMPPARATLRPRPEPRTNVFGEEQARTLSRSDESDSARDEVKVARTGAFASDRRPGVADRSRPTVLATTEVGEFEVGPPSPVSGGPPRKERTVVDVAFEGARAPGGTAGTESADATVRQGQFGEAVVVAEPRRPRPEPVAIPDVPVEIVSKPRPAYTDRARELRVEGEVVLEVLFGASGTLRVIRVVEGLGHGLDDAAVDAAKRIDFKPATRNGKPIDYVATLRVVFQLA